MTPEEIAKQCAEAIRPVRPRQHKNIKNMVLAQQKEVAAKLLPILTAHLAARDAVLRECRVSIAMLLNSFALSATSDAAAYERKASPSYIKGRELLVKIDALTKGECDGK